MIDFDAVTQLAHEAGLAIMEVYDRAGDINVEIKGDESPLTEADLAANDVITRGLSSLTPEIPIVSEEGKLGDPREAPYCWLVDPLDGTKEFIKRNGEFTVNIALARDGVPVLGVIYVPVTGELYVGAEGEGGERQEGWA